MGVNDGTGMTTEEGRAGAKVGEKGRGPWRARRAVRFALGDGRWAMEGIDCFSCPFLAPPSSPNPRRRCMLARRACSPPPGTLRRELAVAFGRPPCWLAAFRSR